MVVRGISLGAGFLSRVLTSVFDGQCQRRPPPSQGLPLPAPCSRLGMPSQYPWNLWDLERLGIEASISSPQRLAPLLAMTVRCPGWLKSRRPPRGIAEERSPSKAPVVFRLTPGQGLTIQ